MEKITDEQRKQTFETRRLVSALVPPELVKAVDLFVNSIDERYLDVLPTHWVVLRKN